MDLSGDGVLELLAVGLSRELVNLAGISPEIAEEVAVETIEKTRALVAGQNVYFSFGLIQRCAKRDREIFAEFTGNNIKELAYKHHLSDMRIRQIVSHQRKIPQRK